MASFERGAGVEHAAARSNAAATSISLVFIAPPEASCFWTATRWPIMDKARASAEGFRHSRLKAIELRRVVGEDLALHACLWRPVGEQVEQLLVLRRRRLARRRMRPVRRP